VKWTKVENYLAEDKAKISGTQRVNMQSLWICIPMIDRA